MKYDCNKKFTATLRTVNRYALFKFKTKLPKKERKLTEKSESGFKGIFHNYNEKIDYKRDEKTKTKQSKQVPSESWEIS